MDRRTLLRRTALLGAVGAAGCSGGDGDTTETDSETTDQAPAGTATPAPTESETLSDSEVITLSGPPCEAIDSTTFRSIETQPGGPAPDEESTAFHWQVRFGDGEYSYTHTDVVETGSYACTVADDEATVDASASATDVTYTGTYDPESGVLTWDGVRYRPVETA
jgi:hypothetical protein